MDGLFYFHGETASRGGQDLLIIVVSLSYSETPQSVGLVWTSDQPDAETFTLQNTHWQETDSHEPGGIRTLNPSKQAATDPPIRRRGHWDGYGSGYFGNWEGVNWI